MLNSRATWQQQRNHPLGSDKFEIHSALLNNTPHCLQPESLPLTQLITKRFHWSSEWEGVIAASSLDTLLHRSRSGMVPAGVSQSSAPPPCRLAQTPSEKLPAHAVGHSHAARDVTSSAEMMLMWLWGWGWWFTLCQETKIPLHLSTWKIITVVCGDRVNVINFALKIMSKKK